MGLALALFTYLIWKTVRGFLVLLINIFWFLNGTYSKIKKSHQKDAYYKTVQVLTIWARHKLDPVLQPSGPDNFIAFHSSFEDPDYVLADNVSLFNVNKNNAIFVEVEKGVDVSNSDNGVFLRIAQWKMARKLIMVPIHIFHQLGEKVGQTKAKIIFLAHTGRCGSTLLVQVFEQTGLSIAYSEPDAFNALTKFTGISDNELNKIVIHTINLLCKPHNNRNIQSFVIKPTSILPPVTIPLLRKLFPKSYFLFMYRDGLSVSKSLSRARNELPLAGLIVILGHLCPKLSNLMTTALGLTPETPEKVSSGIQYFSVLWAADMRQYLDCHEQGINIVGLRYEDIIDDPNYALQKIFEHCELDFDVRAAERALGRDSQRASPLSMNSLGKYILEEFTDEIKKHTDEVCDHFRVPRFPEKFIAPGTITGKL